MLQVPKQWSALLLLLSRTSCYMRYGSPCDVCLILSYDSHSRYQGLALSSKWLRAIPACVVRDVKTKLNGRYQG